MASFFSELKRRNVFRVAGAYAVVSWLLAQIGTTLEETLRLPGWFDSFIVAVLLIALPIALLIAWAFELTPEGIVRTESAPEYESITADTGRKLDIAIVTGLVVVGAMVLWQQFGDSPRLAPNEIVPDEGARVSSIAVLPFDDLSPDGDQEYFSDGIAEEILNWLVRVEGLDVTSRTSSFQFKDAGLGIPEIARELNVRHIVEGSVRKSGDTIRVTAQLIDTVSDKHLWSRSYDRPLTTDNIFEIQDGVANSIVQALRDTLIADLPESVEVTAMTGSLTAYELYLKARPLFNTRTDLDIVEEHLREALAQDPVFAKAWEMRAANRMLSRQYGYSEESRAEASAGALEYAERALLIDPDSSLAIAVRAKLEYERALAAGERIDHAKFVAEFTRALTLDPRNSSARIWRGLLFKTVGYLELALADFEACKLNEPLYSPCVTNRFLIMAALGRDEEAVEAYRQALGIGVFLPGFPPLTSMARLGEGALFKSATNDSRILFGWRRHDELYEAYRNPGQDYGHLVESIRAHMTAAAGVNFGAFSFITHPLRTDLRTVTVHILWDPSLRHYRQSEAFRTMIIDTGTYDFWLVSGFPPQCRSVNDGSFECD